jgi:hypothetical protein
MSKFDELYEGVINEAKARRAWSNRLVQIDKLMAWMYTKDILNKGEKKRKDVLFRQYYRYYNDGDFPKSLESKGLGRWSDPKQVETALEELLEEFIKKILSKYMGKINRKEFYLDEFLQQMETLKGVVGRYDAYSLLDYWGKKIDVKNSDFEKLLKRLKGEYKTANDAVNKAVDTLEADPVFDWHDTVDRFRYTTSIKTYNVTYKKEALESIAAWDKTLSAPYDKMAGTMDEMAAIIDNIIEATNKAKTALGG